MQAWVIGNWKQNPATRQEADRLIDDLLLAIRSYDIAADKSAANSVSQCQIMIAPSCIHLSAISSRLGSSQLLCAAQDISAHSHNVGAYTGECSAQQITDAGATWTILGHSERRQYHQESNAALVDKMDNALMHDLGIVLCIGETQAQYDAKQTLAVLDEQLMVISDLLVKHTDQVNSTFAKSLADKIMIAYEPVWAIGTGKVPTVAEVNATHQHIKQTVASFAEPLANIKVLYGGSVNAANADSFATSSVIDGALVGGASLQADSFMAIAKAFSDAKA